MKQKYNTPKIDYSILLCEMDVIVQSVNQTNFDLDWLEPIENI